jgi:uncharacterized protein DUF2786
MEDCEKILVRIKKMMALANDRAASEGERDNAMRMVHGILAKYNLTMAEADSTSLSPEEKRTGRAMDTGGRKFPHVWQRNVAMAIANLYFCNYFFTQHKDQKVDHFFIGKHANVYTAQEMTKYVITSIEKEARSSRKAHHGDGAYERNFAKGAAEVLNHRCHEIRRAAEAKPSETNSCTALVLASVYQKEKEANAKYLAEVMNIRLRSAKMTQHSSHSDGRHQGRQYGNQINLNTQLGGGSSSRPRLT